MKRWNRSWGSIVTGHPSTLTDFFAPSVLTWSFFLKTRSAAVCPSMALKLACPTSLVLLTFSDTYATTPVAVFLRVGSSANGFLSLKICGEDHHVFRVLGWSCWPHLHVLVAGKSSCAGDFLPVEWAHPSLLDQREKKLFLDLLFLQILSARLLYRLLFLERVEQLALLSNRLQDLNCKNIVC